MYYAIKMPCLAEIDHGVNVEWRHFVRSYTMDESDITLWDGMNISPKVTGQEAVIKSFIF